MIRIDYEPRRPRRWSKLAIACFVASLFLGGFARVGEEIGKKLDNNAGLQIYRIFCYVPGTALLILSAKTFRGITRSEGGLRGKGFAIAAITLTCLILLLFTVVSPA
jgi:hypothetical protein